MQKPAASRSAGEPVRPRTGEPVRRRTGAHARVHALAKMIPSGKVATYGQLAAIAGGCTPRMAGYAMAGVRPEDNVPWHRVINSQGRVSERPGAEVQRAMLEAEGVAFSTTGTIDLGRFGWSGPGGRRRDVESAEDGKRSTRIATDGAERRGGRVAMSGISGFTGFTKETVEFFRELARHNDKRWFDSHKVDYQDFVIEPARAFVTAMSARLQKIAPEIAPDTRTTGAGSIFRIYRDTRFSKDKMPYKTHLGIFLWDGRMKKLESRGFYFHIEPPNMILSAGMYRFTPDQLAVYRDAVADPKSGTALTRAIKKVTGVPGCAIGDPHYKRVPRGFDPDHPRAELLKHNGMYVFTEGPIPKEFTRSSLVDYCFDRWKPMMPLYRWLDRVSG